MHVQADIVPQLVREQHLQSLDSRPQPKTSASCHSAAVKLWARDRSAHLPAHVEAQLLQLLAEALLGYRVQGVEGEARGGAAEGDGAALDGEDGGVEVLLRGGEGAAGGEGARDVGYVAAV